MATPIQLVSSRWLERGSILRLIDEPFVFHPGTMKLLNPLISVTIANWENGWRHMIGVAARDLPRGTILYYTPHFNTKDILTNINLEFPGTPKMPWREMAAYLSTQPGPKFLPAPKYRKHLRDHPL